MKKSVLIILVATISSLFAQYTLSGYAKVVAPKRDASLTVEFVNNNPVQFVLVKDHFLTYDEDPNKYYVEIEQANGDMKKVDSFTVKDFVNDTLKRGYLFKLTATRFLEFGVFTFFMKPVSVITNIDDQSHGDIPKGYRYYNLNGQEMIQPKGIVIRSDGQKVWFVE